MLLPAAGALVALPVQAQQRVVVAQAPVRAATPDIERFTVQPQGVLVPGRELRFRVSGSPGAKATLAIPGVVRNIALKETRRGVYEGRYTVRRKDDPRAFDHAVATLRVGPRAATARIALPETRAERRDNSAPRVTQVTPANGTRVDERGRTFIQARLSDQGTGVDPASVRLIVDGLDVTRNARITADAVGYREELGRGQHRAELVVRDHAGNLHRSAWTFRVV
jgi:hypothetical protein